MCSRVPLSSAGLASLAMMDAPPPAAPLFSLVLALPGGMQLQLSGPRSRVAVDVPALMAAITPTAIAKRQRRRRRGGPVCTTHNSSSTCGAAAGNAVSGVDDSSDSSESMAADASDKAPLHPVSHVLRNSSAKAATDTQGPVGSSTSTAVPSWDSSNLELDRACTWQSPNASDANDTAVAQSPPGTENSSLPSLSVQVPSHAPMQKTALVQPVPHLRRNSPEEAATNMQSPVALSVATPVESSTSAAVPPRDNSNLEIDQTITWLSPTASDANGTTVAQSSNDSVP